MDEQSTSAAGRVECPAKKDPAVRLFIMAGIFLGFGLWCVVERGKYPAPDAWDVEHINEAAGHALNHYGPYLFIPVGLFFLGRGVRALRRVLIADEEGIGYRGREKLPWSQITALDAGRLRSKGILTLHYGSDGKLVLDSWKLQNFRGLIALVEQKVPPEAQPQGEPTPPSPPSGE